MGRASDQTRCVGIVLCSLFLYSAAIVMIVIGTLNLPHIHYMDGCRSAPGMPLFNITGGSIIMIGLFIREILKRFCECCNSCCDDEKACRIGGQILKCGFTLIYDLGFMLIAAVWLIFGTASVIEPFRETLGDDLTTAFGTLKNTSDTLVKKINIQVVTDHLTESSQPQQELEGSVECDEVLYHLTIVVLITGWIIIGLGALYLLIFKIFYPLFCCKPCKDNRRHGDMDVIHMI
jgi:hypothetical protein